MCMKVFALQRCAAEASGGCDQYYAGYVGVQECNKMSLPGLPYPDCRAVWAGFETELSTTVQRHDFYARRPRVLCPTCQRAHDRAHYEQQAQIERRGEYSDRVKQLLANAARRAELNEGAFMTRCYNKMWEAAHRLVIGLSEHADRVWGGIDAALWEHFGARGIGQPVVQGLIANLRDAKAELVAHVRTTTKEMAVALVGPNLNWDEVVGVQEQLRQDDYEEDIE